MNQKSSPQKYLLLIQPDEEFPEQFNSYMFLVMEVIALAKKLGRVFVLPRIHSHPRNSLLCEAGETDHAKMIYGKIDYPFESFFDIDQLNSYVDTISFEDFCVRSERKLDKLFCFNDLRRSPVVIYGTEFSVNYVQKTTGLDDLTNATESFIAIAGYKRGVYLAKSSPNWHNDPNLDYWGIRKHLVYRKDLLETAKVFARDYLGEKYLALHWRRGDRCHPEMGKVREDQDENEKEMRARLDYYLVRPIKKILNKYDIDKVFLATNSGTQWHVDYLKKNLPIVQYPHQGSWKMMELESVIEQIICTGSFYYFSSPYSYKRCSSFSRWIIDSRILLGTDKHVSFQKKMGPITRPLFWRLFYLLLSATRKIRGFFGLRLSTLRQKFAQNNTPPKSFVPGNLSMRGVLFRDKVVHIDPRAVDVGGCWYPHVDHLAKAWEPGLLEQFYDEAARIESPIIFDIGANTGSFSLLATFNPGMKIYAFEPQPQIREILEKNLELNNITKRVSTFKLALSDKKGWLTLHTPKEHNLSGLATLGTPKRFVNFDTLQIETITMDEFVENNAIPKVDLIKIDTEGAELLILKGGERFIRKHMPVILLEYNAQNTAQFGYDPKKILHLLLSWGYDIYRISNEDILCRKSHL